MHPVKILVAAQDDRLADALCAGIGRDQAMRLAGRYSSAGEAIAMAELLGPDVIALDLRLNDMETLQVIAGLNRACRAAVVALGPAMGGALPAMKAGAVDFIHLPVRGSESDCRLFAADAVVRLKVAPLGRVEVPLARMEHPGIRLIAVVAAQGGLVQSACLLKALPERCPPVLILQQHPEWSGDYLRRLSVMSGRKAVVGVDGVMLDGGTAVVLDGRSDMSIDLFDDGIVLRVAPEDTRQFAASADLLFRAVSKALGGAAAGISLSGEGISGLTALAKAGGLAMQHEKNALLGQPCAASRGDIAGMTLEDMAQEIGKWLR